ncbi:hypothetical protein A0O28_0103790 [Trichoderma guizhouense]|uniref:Uncharacterized protein n=1 Tax=Trichoderma guizhouense TaxID=1491466 RepID=A0A1T3CL49_9HYPO|nr:hypothetical protein A0O28_0103790 [Trichoderma guizhouense]
MPSTQKSYFLPPHWQRRPSHIPLGGVITSVTDEREILRNKDLPTDIDTEIYTKEAKSCSGKIELSYKGHLGLFSSIQLARTRPKAPYAWKTEVEYKYACELIETRSFKPSPEFLAKVAANPAFKSRLKYNYWDPRAKVFVVTGVKIANSGSITHNRDSLFATGVGGRRVNQHSQIPIEQPMLFAFQVEQVYFTWTGKLATKAYVKGAHIGQEDNEAEDKAQDADEDLVEEDEAKCGMETHNGLVWLIWPVCLALLAWLVYQ